MKVCKGPAQQRLGEDSKKQRCTGAADGFRQQDTECRSQGGDVLEQLGVSAHWWDLTGTWSSRDAHKTCSLQRNPSGTHRL